MTDNVSKNRRSEIMSLVGQKDTTPEMIVRSYLHNNGLRFRLHVKNLPGKPDLVLKRWHAVVFVNGCFWHGHNDSACKLARIPKSNVAFWKNKIERNRARDQKNWQALQRNGWHVFVVWECQCGQKDHLKNLVYKIKHSRVEARG